MHVARCEAAWLEGRNEDARRDAEAHVAAALSAQQMLIAAQLGLWCGSVADATSLPAACAEHPCGIEAAGQWQAAAQAWQDLGCPFETARALSHGDETAQRQALAMFEKLGARPMVERVAHALRAAGVRGLRAARAARPANTPAA